MAYSIVANTAQDSADGNSVTTSGIDTTAANLIAVFVAAETGGSNRTPSDSQGNTWTAIGSDLNDGGIAGRWWYKAAPTTNAAHTFSITGTGNFCSIWVVAVSGAAASPLDQSNGATALASTSLATGSITPTENDELILAAIACQQNQSGGISVDAGMVELNEINAAPNGENGLSAYVIQASAAAINPTFAFSASDVVAQIVSFKAASASGGFSINMFPIRPNAFAPGLAR